MKITNFTLFTLMITMGFGVFSVPSNGTEALRGMDLDDPETLGEILAVAVPLHDLREQSHSEGMLYYQGNTNKPFSGWTRRMYKNGHVEGLVRLEMGERVSLYQWFPNGQIASQENLKQDKRDGMYISWAEDGVKVQESNYKEGNLDGLNTSWYRNGQNRSKVLWKDGQKDGFSIFWYSNGGKKAQLQWEKGKMISAEAWKANGEKCPETRVKNGNGVYLKRDGTGAKLWSVTYKKGEGSPNPPPAQTR